MKCSLVLSTNWLNSNLVYRIAPSYEAVRNNVKHTSSLHASHNRRVAYAVVSARRVDLPHTTSRVAHNGSLLRCPRLHPVMARSGLPPAAQAACRRSGIAHLGDVRLRYACMTEKPGADRVFVLGKPPDRHFPPRGVLLVAVVSSTSGSRMPCKAERSDNAECREDVPWLCPHAQSGLPPRRSRCPC